MSMRRKAAFPLSRNLTASAGILSLILLAVQSSVVFTASFMKYQTICIAAGFLLDFVFTLIFLSRLISAFAERKAGQYLVRRRGWLDFAASLPPLLFHSVPLTFLLLTNTGGFFLSGPFPGAFGLAALTRTAGLLRLLRLAMHFSSESRKKVMVGRHLSILVSLTTTSLVFSFAAILSVLHYIPVVPQHQEDVVEQLSAAGFPIENWSPAAPLILVKREGVPIYTAYENDYLSTHFGILDYSYQRFGSWEVFSDFRLLRRLQAFLSLLALFLSAVLYACLQVFYRRKLIRTVRDPIEVMRKGFSRREYNLAVHIPDQERYDEIFLLAKLYNDRFLPLKDRDGVPGIPGSRELKFRHVQDMLKTGE